MSVDKQTSGLPVCIWHDISLPFSWLFTVQQQIYTDSVYVLYILNYFCMERFQEKCVFRGLLFYWYKVCIFNHTQSMRVINYIILTLKPWTRPLLHFHMVLPIKRASYFLVCVWNPLVLPFKWKLLSSSFLFYCFITFYKRVLTNDSVDKFPCWDLPNYSLCWWYFHMVLFLVISGFFF